MKNNLQISLTNKQRQQIIIFFFFFVILRKIYGWKINERTYEFD